MLDRFLTAQQHISQQQHKYPNANGDFSWLLGSISLATKRVAAEVRRAGLTGILGSTGDVNVQGEVQQQLDLLANNYINSLSWTWWQCWCSSFRRKRRSGCCSR